MKKIVSILLALMLCMALCVPAFAKEDANNSETESAITLDAHMGDNKGGSALSEGSLTIIVGVAAAVVFGLGGFFVGKAVGKKKKPAADEE